MLPFGSAQIWSPELTRTWQHSQHTNTFGRTHIGLKTCTAHKHCETSLASCMRNFQITSTEASAGKVFQQHRKASGAIPVAVDNQPTRFTTQRGTDMQRLRTSATHSVPTSCRIPPPACRPTRDPGFLSDLNSFRAYTRETVPK